jgi:hypothetical protein
MTIFNRQGRMQEQTNLVPFPSLPGRECGGLALTPQFGGILDGRT